MSFKKIFLNCYAVLSEKKSVILLFLFSIFFLLLKHFQFHLILFLHSRHFGAILNFLSGVSISQPIASINFYSGAIEESFFGPLSAVFSFLFLASFSLRYLKKASAITFFFVIFLFLLITKYEILLFPPFGDDITGPFAEAVWLHHNSFDYIGLSRQPTYIHGGPKLYLFSIYPTFLALGMSLIPSVPLFLFFNHLVSLGLAAGIVSIFRSFLLKFFNQRIALLLSILLLSVPVFQSQAEAINMEMPALFFSLWSIYALSQKKFLKAAFFASLAISVKMYCFFIGATIFLGCALISIFQRDKIKPLSVFLFGSLPFVFGIIQILLLFFFLEADQHNYAVGFFVGRHWLLRSWVLYFYIFSVIVFLKVLSRKVFLFSRRRINIEFLFKKNQNIFFCFLAVASWFVVFGQSYFFGVRYYVVMIPFFIACLSWAGIALLRNRFIVEFFIVILIMFSSLFSYGMNYPSKVYGQGAARSLEYRSEVRFFKKITRLIEQRFSDSVIGAPILIAHSLGIEELGYVRNNMNVKIYFWPAKYGGIQELSQDDIMIREQIIWVASADETGEMIVFDPVNDVILDRIVYGSRRAILFKGGYRIFYILKRAQPLIDAFESKQVF